MIEWLIPVSLSVLLTGAGCYVVYLQHLKRLEKLKAKHEKEKHYLRRDQRARLREAKAKTREYKALMQALADKKAHDAEMQNLTNTLQAVTHVNKEV